MTGEKLAVFFSAGAVTDAEAQHRASDGHIKQAAFFVHGAFQF
jgi:hypothetical protein